MPTHEVQTNLDFVFLLRKRYSWNTVHSIWIARLTINSKSSSIATYVIRLYRKCIYKQPCKKSVIIIGQKILFHIQFSAVMGNCHSSPLSTSTLFSCNTLNFETCRGPPFRSNDKWSIVLQKRHTYVRNSDTNVHLPRSIS
jgi:hypothetical protein